MTNVDEMKRLHSAIHGGLMRKYYIASLKSYCEALDSPLAIGSTALLYHEHAREAGTDTISAGSTVSFNVIWNLPPIQASNARISSKRTSELNN
eukprot:3849269-Pleurochrysis_carterae.AAC.11